MPGSDAGWHKSSFSSNSACVEVRMGQVVEVRDSKDREGPVLRFNADEWVAFVNGVMNGEFNHGAA